jgi:hypothetical protein
MILKYRLFDFNYKNKEKDSILDLFYLLKYFYNLTIIREIYKIIRQKNRWVSANGALLPLPFSFSHAGQPILRQRIVDLERLVPQVVVDN